jgi:hypothetical protein
MEKCIVTGILPRRCWVTGKNCPGSFWILNGDIELDEQGKELYIESKIVEGTSESEDVIKHVDEMPKEVQEYIATHKRLRIKEE